MLWRLGIAAPILVGLVGCAPARPVSSPAPAASASTAAVSLESLAGEYSLVAIDGHALPYPQASGDASRSTSWPVLDGALSLRSNGTFHIETTYNTDASGKEKNSYELTGTCFDGGGSFRMVWDGGGQTQFVMHRDTLVLDNEGRAFSYVRR